MKDNKNKNRMKFNYRIIQKNYPKIPYFKLRGKQIRDDCDYFPLKFVSYAYQYQHDANTQPQQHKEALTQFENPLFRSLVSLNILNCSQCHRM